ncbi:hypothetical protein [Methylocystis bryophila]|uniref:Nitrogen fixation protein NifU n=1 Tax=Methylocystis bryophila TaxID=655015 RepID=A0A1W6MUE5_9HYPH|nr:hypothetical protein [Methylocystis bryophila]ARN81187.1 hypothetical protein B1812_08940 [Methylocystis bryophila]BDV37125.1 hypothetical protein DSM21852_03780 [Methylocystis bryophila]
MVRERSHALRRCLERVDEARERLERTGDNETAVVARNLLSAVMDLHGLALVRALILAQSGAAGDDLAQRFVEDDYVAAVLLLHGLHPEDPETRLQKKLFSMRPHWGVRGFRVELLAVERGAAKAKVHWDDAAGETERSGILREIESVLTDAAPDLDLISLEEADAGSTDARSPASTVMAQP